MEYAGGNIGSRGLYPTRYLKLGYLFDLMAMFALWRLL